MNHNLLRQSLSAPRLGGALLAALFFLGTSEALRAESPPAPVPTGPVLHAPAATPGLLADSGFRKFFTAPSSRGRIIQICVVVMCLALFIMMRKFTGERPSGERGRVRAPREIEKNDNP